MDLSMGALVASLVVGTVGFGLFLYGKKQGRLPQFIIGLVMMVYPYLLPSPIAVWCIAVVLVVTLRVLVRSGM